MKITLSSNVLAQYSHFVSGALVVITAHDFYGWQGVAFSIIAVWILIGLKEAFIDPLVETPETAGSGLEDWSWWAVGTIVAVLFISVMLHFKSPVIAPLNQW